MELKFEVLASTTIKRKKPWPKFAWLTESEPPHGLYLLDSCRISQVSPTTGKTRRKLPPLGSVQSNISLLAHSPNGAYLGGLTAQGDMFLWEKETDIVESFVTPLSRMDSESVKTDPLAFQGHKLFLSDSGEHALLIAGGSAIFLWELGRERVGPVWWKVFPPDGVLLPDTCGCNREAVIHASFNTHPVFGKCCSCVFVFTSSNGTNNHHPHTAITHLLISWPSPTSLFYSSLSPNSPLHGNQTFPFSTAVDSETSTESRDEDGPLLKSEGVEERAGNVGNLPSKDESRDEDRNVLLKSKESEESGRRKGPLSDVTNSNLANPLDHTKHHGVKKEQQTQHHPFKFDAFLTPEHQPFQTSWRTVFYVPDNQARNIASSTHALLTKRGCYVCRLSHTGSIAALAVNRREASNTAVVFFSPLVDASMSAPLYLSKAKEKTGRSYWVSDMAWLADGLLLACITKRGSLVILPRFGRPLMLVTHGHSPLDVGPAVFLPLHPLVTVKGHHRQSQQPDHSQSSEVDVLRQRFSVSAHPLHPVLLCSDGYSFTILQLVTRVPLSQLTAGLVLDSRKKLNLSPSGANPIHEESFALRSSLNLGDVHDFAATLTDLDATGLDDTLGSTLLSSVAGGGALFGSLEAGAVQFAGMDSDLEQTQSFLATSLSLKKHSVEVATFQLRAALGVLLSCDRLEPGNGVFPQLQPLKHSEVEKLQLEIQQAYRLFLSTFLTLMETSVVASRTEVSSGANTSDPCLEGLFHELFGDILGLVPLDSFSQSHLELVTALINGGLLIVLRSSMQKHRGFTSWSQGQPTTIQLLKEFADSVCEDISIISELLEGAVSVLNTTYGMRPLSGADSAFHAPLHSSKRRHHRHHSGDVVSCLSISLTNMLEVLGAFWQDIQSCGDIANETISGITSSSLQHNRLQLREIGVLCKGLASSLQAAMMALKASHAQIRRLIQAGKKKGVQIQLETSLSAREQGQDGNPITSSTNENLSLLLSKLEEYDLKGALELIHSDDILVHSTSFSIPADAGLSLNASTATLNSTISHTHLSLAAPSAQPVVTCLAKVLMAFFSNQKLLIPPSTIANTPGSTAQGGGCTKRLVELKRSEVVQAVHEQELSKVWTADCALELALLGGLWEETVKFVANLGEWKKAILLSLAYLNHNKLLTEKIDTRNQHSIHHLESVTDFSHRLALDSIIDLLGLEISGNEIVPLGCTGKGRPSYSSTCSPQHCTEESFHSIAGTLQVCAAGGMDSVLVKLVISLTGAVTTRARRLPLTVHSSVYLPAPPLYCPQPTIPEEEYIQCPDEYGSRYTISHLVHSLVLTLKASNCLHSCAQWYCSELLKLTKASGRRREAFALPGKKIKGGLPTRALSNLANSSQSLINENDGLSSSVVRILLACFRQLCGLMWFLHARDQASAHLRKLQPSLSRPDRDPDTVQKSALWCCRLLSFAEFLTQNGGTKTTVDLQLTALSALSELPNDKFFANLLALYFPNSSLNDRNLDAKFQRLMSRLRSTQDPTTEQLLSVIYQTKSQKVLRQRDAVFTEGDGRFQTLISCQTREQKLFEHDFWNIEVHSQALNVGCFVFEYDVDYLNFLDTLFAVTLQSESYKPTTSKLMLSTTSLSRSMLAHTDQPNLAKLPLVSECVKVVKTCDSSDTSPCWHHLLPLLHLLKEWSDIPQPQPRQLQKSRQSEGKLKSKKNKGSLAAMRVNVPLELVVNCLRQEEERMAAEVGKEVPSSQLAGEGDIKEHTSSSLASVTSCILSSSASGIDQTMQIEELEGKRETEHVKVESRNQAPLPLPIEEPANTARDEPNTATLSLTSADTRDHIDGRNSGATVSGRSFPLLKVPEGVLQGKLSHDAVQRALMASPLRQSKPHKFITTQPGTSSESKKPQPSITSSEEGGGKRREGEKGLEVKKSQEEAVAIIRRGDTESEGSSVVDDLELTDDGLSTGEIPSDITFSIGEVGWRLTPGYDTPHSTLGAQTLQLLSSTGNAGDALSSRADHTATVHAPGTTTCTAEDNDKEECLEKAVGIELEEADIGQNHSTSTLVNEDSILTPTQSSSSLSALTLTEISRMEGSQSTTVQLKKGGEDTPMDTRQKELAATSEATSQLSLKLDECAHEDKPLDKPPGCTSTESVTTSQLLAGKKAAGNGDSVEGIGDNGGTRREMVGREVEGGAELSQGLGRIDVDGHPKQEPDTSLVISDIVRSEMKKILEIQHQQLLSLLDGSNATPSASHSIHPPSFSQTGMELATSCQHQAPALLGSHTLGEQQLQAESDDSLPPILNVDDLRSLTPSEPSTTEQASHISVAIPPPPQSKPTPTVNTTQITQNTAGRDHHKPLQHSRMRHSSSSSIHSSRIGAELKTKVASTPAKPKKSSSDLHGGREGRQKSFRWSDLDTDSEFYGHPGHAGNGGYQNNIHVLSSSAETTDFNRTGDSGDDRGGNSRISKKRRKFEKKVKARSSSGLFTHTQQFGKHGGIQLLHLEPFDRERGHTARRDEGQLEHEFPGLAKALKQFNDSVAPSFQQFASAGSKTQPAATGYKSMPLLQLPHMPDEAPPVAPPSFHVPKQAPPIAPPTMQPPPHVQQARYQSSAVGGKVPMPLLIIPNQPQTLSIPHPVSAGGGSNHNIPPPPADSANLPTAVSHLTTSQASYLTYVPGPMRSSVGPHTTAVKPSLLHNPHTFSSPHPAPSGAQHSSIDFKLPQVPVRPFVPILLPPPPPPPSQILNHGRQADTSCDPTSASVRPMGPQLLQLNDPLSRMKREGFKLLKDDPRDGEERVLPELRLLHLERGPPPPPSSIEEQEELKKILPTAKTEQTREQPQMTADVKQSGLKQVDSSGGSLTTISSTTEESSEMPPPSESRGDRGGERQGRTGRRQRGRRGKGVAWKMDQEESEKPQESSANATSSEIDGDTYTLSNKDETVCPWTLPAHSGSDHTEGKSEKKPLIGQSSGKNRSFPDEIPLQRLELRRLDMNASFIPTSPQLHVSPSSPGQESIHHVGATETTDNRLNDRPLSSSLAKTCPPKTSEIGIQVDPMPVKATPEGGEERETLTNSCSTSEQPSVIEPAAKMTISSAVQVSPEHFSETGGEKRTKASEQSAAIDSIEVTSVSSLDSEEVRVQLSDSDDDENDGGLPSTEQQDEFMPPPLWHNSHSPIPIPAKTKGTDSPIPEAKEAPPVSSSLFAGFSATPPPPLPMPLSMESANDQEHLNPKSHSQSPVPEISHQQPSVQVVLGGSQSGPRPLKSDVMERLHQLEEQLNAIESTAKSVEGEFKTTNQILFTIDRLQAVSDTLTNVTGGSHGDGDIGFLHRDHSRAEISPPSDNSAAALPPLSPDGDGGSDMKLEDVGGLSLSRHESQGNESLNPGASRVVEGVSKSRRSEGPHCLHQDAECLKEKDTEVPERGGHDIDRESGHGSLKKAVGGKGGRERGREELRSWMAAKRRERLAQFVAERDKLRKREKHPFQPPPSPKTGNSSMRGQKQASLLKREKEKDFIARRIEDAYILMNDILTSKPAPSPSHPSTTSPPPSLPTAHLPPNCRGRGGARGQRRKRVASGGQKKVAFSTSSAGLMKSSQSDSRLYREEEQGEERLSSDEVLGSIIPSSLHGTYSKNSDLANYRLGDTDMKRTQASLSSKHGAMSPPIIVNNKGSQRTPTIRKISSVDGLTEDEQDKIAAILASTDYDGQSVSSGSIVSNIDWEQVDRILDS